MKTSVKNVLAAGVIAAVTVLQASAQTAPKWEIDKSHASVKFSVNHFFSAVDGKFKAFKGDFYFNPELPSASKFNFEIDVNSISTDEPDRDKHLQSEDFFDAAKWPKIKFVSTSVVKKGKDAYVIKGNLTMRDKTLAVELPMKITGMMENPWNKEKVILGIAINATLDRTKWGVGTGSWAATAIVGDEVTIAINMELDGLMAGLQ
jgi:polyisoprenoid-binding protein YceI